MTEFHPEETGGMTPTLEVRAYRAGRLLARGLCESVSEAAGLSAAWEEIEGVDCEIIGLSPAGMAGRAEPADQGDDAADYPSALEADRVG